MPRRNIKPSPWLLLAVGGAAAYYFLVHKRAAAAEPPVEPVELTREMLRGRLGAKVPGMTDEAALRSRIAVGGYEHTLSTNGAGSLGARYGRGSLGSCGAGSLC